MSDKHLPHQGENEEETPEWLKLIQLNSWEAELLVSALFLYILFQIPDTIDMYRKVHFSGGNSLIYGALGFFRKALIVLSIGYVIHIITRGIWVANIGLSYVFPRGLDLDRLRLKGKFREELEGSGSLNNSVLLLEKIASMAYAVSFISSALVISVGAILLTLLFYVQYVFQPLLESGEKGWYFFAFFVITVYALILLLVFVDFITNGFFRRDAWASRPYYYIMMVFRVLTLSFIYNRMLLTIISSLPKWKAHLIPIIFVGALVLFEWISTGLEGLTADTYYEQSFETMRPENYESFRNEKSVIIATIQDDIIEENVIRLFLSELSVFGEIHGRDRKREKEWHQLEASIKSDKIQKFLDISIDSTRLEEIEWRRYRHPTSFQLGYLAYIDVTSLPAYDHSLVIALDTVSLNEKQKEYLLELEPSRMIQAKIPFYKTE